MDGADEVDDPLLPRHAPDEEDVRDGRVDTTLLEEVRGWVGTVERGVDPVVNDVDALLRHIEEAEDVVARAAADGDDGLGGFMAVRSIQVLTSYPPPSCSRFQGRSGSSEWTVSASGMP